MGADSYYSRQMRLPEVGQAGQERLKNSSCLVIGAGGLGSPALLYLASAGIGKIGVCDGDTLEESNLHRQPLYSQESIGTSKALLAAERIEKLNPWIEVVSYPYRLRSDNALSLFSSYDLILDCTDNFRTKFLINDAAYLSKKPVVRASIYQFEGQLQTYIPKEGTACLRCMWEETPQEGCVGSCQEVGVLGPIPGYFGVLQAMEALKFFLQMPTLGFNEILFSDLIYYTQRIVSCDHKKECPLCGDNPTIQTLSEKAIWEVEHRELKSKSFQLIDIREEEEIEADPYPGGKIVHNALSAFDSQALSPEVDYLLVCQRGKRSGALVLTLRARGITNVYSLIDGVNGLSK